MLAWAMQNLSPHRTLIDLNDTTGCPQVLKGTPVPRRKQPLPGLKSLSCPPDAHFAETMAFHPTPELAPSRASIILGGLAMAVAVAVAVGGLLSPWLGRLEFFAENGAPLVFFGFVATHLCGFLARLFSGGRNRLGGWSVVVFWAGLVLYPVLSHWLD